MVGFLAPVRKRAMDTKPGRILVVDDEENNRDILVRRLTRVGHEVLAAASGQEALTAVDGKPPDLVLLDIMMPGMSGMETLTRLRRTYTAAQLPVIMATAKSETEDIVEALKAGASDYVTKPLDFPVVIARVGTQLALKQAVDRILQLQRDLERRNEELVAANGVINASNERMKEELADAARIQKALLPQALPRFDRVRFAWAFHPWVELGGDILNVFHVDRRHVAFYLLDVSGHGVPAALLSTALSRVLLPHEGQSSPVQRVEPGSASPRAVPPREVVAELNGRFPRLKGTSQFFTMVYALLDLERFELSYVRAGHPPPILVRRSGTSEELALESPAVGVRPDVLFTEGTVPLSPGDRVYLYSDGVTEAMNSQGQEFQVDRLAKILRKHATSALEESLEGVSAAVHSWCNPTKPGDDVSILALEVLQQ